MCNNFNCKKPTRTKSEINEKIEKLKTSCLNARMDGNYTIANNFQEQIGALEWVLTSDDCNEKYSICEIEKAGENISNCAWDLQRLVKELKRLGK